MCLGIIEWVYKFLSRGVIVDVFIEVFWFEFNILKECFGYLWKNLSWEIRKMEGIF